MPSVEKRGVALPINFHFKHDPRTLVDVFGVTPERTDRLAALEIAKLSIFIGNRPAPLGDVFEVSIDDETDHHIWRGDLKNVNGIGHGMRGGWIQIDGDVGNHLGSQMVGGTIQLKGNAGDYLGAEMSGGLIQVEGNAGDFVGGKYLGRQSGQSGGAILIEGSAGNSVGWAMRRGVIAIRGDVGNCCGYLMRAGTIVVGGNVRKNVGLEMVRGSIVLLCRPKNISDGFESAGKRTMPVIRLIGVYLRELGFSKPLDFDRCELFHGDTLCGGRGELMVAST